MPWEPKKGGDQRSSKERKHRKSITTNTKDVSNYNRSRKDPWNVTMLTTNKTGII